MSVHIRLVALLGLCWAGPVAAQAAPAERTWTDPPARSDMTVPAVRPAPQAPQAIFEKAPQAISAKAPQAISEKVPQAMSKAPKVAEARTGRHPPGAAVHRRPTVVRTLTPTHPGLAQAPVRIVRARLGASPVRPVRYGFIAPPPPPGAFYEDPRARRIRQAEAAGYLVVRRSTVAAPDGRLLYGYRSYDPDDADD